MPVPATFVPVRRLGRSMRNPQHRFQLRFRPFQLQPFLLAPVIPGETMKNLLLQARCVTDPIKNGLVGWWLEFYFFYVKHRDLDARDTLSNMHLVMNTDVSALKYPGPAADAPYYTYDDGMDWARLCLKRVTEEYFRDQGEAWNNFLIDTLPAVKVNHRDWTESLLDAAAVTAVDVADDDDTPASEIEQMMRTWEFMRDAKFINMTFEDFLRSHGVRSRSVVEPHKPELLRYVREWQYPSNTVDPVSGAAAAAVSWAAAERADKDRFFTEPGFIFGVACVRPKVYSSTQSGSAAGLMDNAFLWLPALLADDPSSSLAKKAVSEGPLQGTAGQYWLDMRDLLIYGDQFVNFATSATDANFVGVPNAALTNKLYPQSADCDALFKSAAPANLVRMDGVVNLSIAGAQVDQT